MARLEVVPFSDEHLEHAGRLLAERHARHREAAPLLSEGFEEPSAAREELAAAWHAEEASGAAAFRDGRLVGYLVGAPREVEVWGENVWVEPAGHAVEEAEDVRDLYAVAAARWVGEERRRHYALVPATDAELVDAWFRLGFGHQQAHGLREVPAQVDVRVPDGFEIREPREEDVETLLAVDIALPAHQRSSPVFSQRPLPTEEELRTEWRSTLAAGEEKVLIGSRDGRPLACWSVCAAELSSQHRSLARPERACYLASASTLPEARGSGIGVALTDASLAAAAEEGYDAMVTDWRVTNLLASRFWPKRGFRTAFARLYRSIP
ncbi:MAG TPA: GNAT family N-acetyltransferase [Gaiellaceae bacterium]|jgi:ribosomal protein S18 acetylase RimI-like enzyme|nr:GNAT family N-acetyltransferase [Gaiellaceae bacterium]